MRGRGAVGGDQGLPLPMHQSHGQFIGHSCSVDWHAPKAHVVGNMKAFVSSFEHDGTNYFVVSRPLGLPVAFAKLTPAELAVAERLLNGCSIRELAAQRGVSERTIANQTAGIYRKLGIATRHELVALAASTPPP